MAQSLTKGATRSCGCLNDETRRIGKHGGNRVGARTLEYQSWASMIQRCTNPKNRKYHRYGARGVGVCPEWSDFTQFLKDMGPRPSAKHTLEREDNDLGYSPGNCIWATKAVQNRNHSRNRFVTFNGETLCLIDWAQRIGVPYPTLHYRLNNWPVDRALTTPRMSK